MAWNKMEHYYPGDRKPMMIAEGGGRFFSGKEKLLFPGKEVFPSPVPSFFKKSGVLFPPPSSPLTRLTTDGKDGNIYVWEKTYTTGGTSYPVTTYYNNVPHTTYHSIPLRFHKNIKEFYFTSDDKCYHWRVATE